jgi:Gas vesicle synthesis protein GvpO/SAP domain
MHDELELEDGVESMTKAELQAEARTRGLPAWGPREALLRRVQDHDRGPREAERAAGQGAEDEGDLAEPPEDRAEPSDSAERSEAEDDGVASAEDAGQRTSGSDDVGHERDERGVQAEAPRDGRRGTRPLKLAEVASTASEALAELTGRPIDAVSGVCTTGQGYRVTIETVEQSRMPSTTDVLGSYEVDVDADGDVTSYVRSHRYYRNQTSRE